MGHDPTVFVPAPEQPIAPTKKKGPIQSSYYEYTPTGEMLEQEFSPIYHVPRDSAGFQIPLGTTHTGFTAWSSPVSFISTYATPFVEFVSGLFSKYPTPKATVTKDPKTGQTIYQYETEVTPTMQLYDEMQEELTSKWKALELSEEFRRLEDPKIRKPSQAVVTNYTFKRNPDGHLVLDSNGNPIPEPTGKQEITSFKGTEGDLLPPDYWEPRPDGIDKNISKELSKRVGYLEGDTENRSKENG